MTYLVAETLSTPPRLATVTNHYKLIHGNRAALLQLFNILCNYGLQAVHVSFFLHVVWYTCLSGTVT